jgi:adenylate cyclase
MGVEDFKRKLTAVLSADVAGYSRLMAEDEAATVKTIASYREVMASLIKQHRGRVVDSPGDNVLAEFASVVDAVQCAVAVQKEFQARNAELPENRKMEFRIGINLGDVIEEEARLYGDGVNIAARLEALAEPGGICVSKTAFDHIESKLPLGYHYLGEQEVKNIPKPVGAYRVVMEPRVTTEGEEEEKRSVFRGRRAIVAGVIVAVVLIIALGIWRIYVIPPQPTVEPASVEKMAYPLPDKPSIAVLPFVNIGGDSEEEDFSDGLTEEIITTLSKVSDLFVIARQSAFSYKGKPVKIGQVAEELGVQYVLEGSVRKGEKRVRVTALLIDALKGHHLWAEGYDRELKDILAVQGEIAKKIITALEVKLTEGEQARVFGKGTDNVEAWALGVRAWKLATKYSKENEAKARELLGRALKLDPNYPFLWTVLGWTHYYDAAFRWTKFPAESLKRSVECAKKALVLDPEDPLAYGLLGLTYLRQKKYEEAIAAGQKAIALDPNYADGYANLSMIVRLSGRFEEALMLSKKAMRLSPNPRVFYPITLAAAYLMLERYEEALPVFKKIFERCRRGECPRWMAHQSLALTYIGLGREEEARAEAQEIMRLNPTYSLEALRKFLPYKDPAYIEWNVSAMRKAGLPEHPPLPLPDKPSIAVLPFVNMSDDPKQEYFVDGMTEDLITDLSKISGLFVIARNSVFRYKGKPVDVKKVSRELGVRHVLEGSVRKAGDQLRITALLIDATTRGQLWAERYDGKTDDVFALQDKITQKIVTALAVQLTASEQEQVAKKETDNIAAYDEFLKGQGHYLRHTPEDYAKALSYFKKATELDANYGRAYASMALIYSRASILGKVWLDALYVHSLIAQRRAKKYLELAMKNPTSTAYRGACFINVHGRRYQEAISDAERALSLDPNDSGCNEDMAYVLIMAGRPHEAFGFTERAMRLDPHNQANPLYYTGLAHFSMKEFSQAANSLERAVKYSPRHGAYLFALAAAYGHLGRKNEAEATLERVLRARTLTSDSLKDLEAHGGRRLDRDLLYYFYPPFKDAEMEDLFYDGLLKARQEGR